MTGDDRTDHAQTKYFGLPLYSDDSPVDLRAGYNQAMRMIDRKLHQLDVQNQERN